MSAAKHKMCVNLWQLMIHSNSRLVCFCVIRAVKKFECDFSLKTLCWMILSLFEISEMSKWKVCIKWWNETLETQLLMLHRDTTYKRPQSVILKTWDIKCLLNFLKFLKFTNNLKITSESLFVYFQRLPITETY